MAREPERQTRGITGREGVRIGEVAERRFENIMREARNNGSFPPWLLRIHGVIERENAVGIDVWAGIEFRGTEDKIPIQIKRSNKQEKRARKKYPHRSTGEQPIIYIVVHPEDSDEDIFRRTIEALEEERARMLRESFGDKS